MHNEPITTTALILLTLGSLFTCLVAARRLRPGPPSEKLDNAQHTLVGLIAAGAIGLYIFRWLALHETRQPLESHLDGLLLLTGLFGLMIWYLTSKTRMPGLAAFAMPLMTLLLLWAVCASRFTFENYIIDSVWKTVHLAGVYVGTIFFAIASIAGGMYLYVQRQLHSKKNPAIIGKLASLEALESLIIRTATLGFAILTLGLITGLVIVVSGPSNLGEQWWFSPKFLLATSVWLTYALVMNVRHTKYFRGARAAWLAICGLILLLATFGVTMALPSSQPTPEPKKNKPNQTSLLLLNADIPADPRFLIETGIAAHPLRPMADKDGAPCI
jgi:ABC-type uncharacterized transport system permease subunit